MSKKLTLANMNAIAGTPLSPANFTFKAKDGADIVITIDPNIGLAQTSAFVDSVADAVFTPDGDYIPEYRDLATFIAVIRELSNIPLPKKGDTVDMVMCHKWMLATGLLKKFRDEDLIDDFGSWFYELEELISNKIDFKKKELMARHQSNYFYFESKLEGLINTFSSIGEQFASIDLNETMDVAKKLVATDTEKIASAIVDTRDAQAKKPAKKTTTKKKEI